MPTYTYQCDSCGHGFEAVQRFADVSALSAALDGVSFAPSAPSPELFGRLSVMYQPDPLKTTPTG